MSASVSNALTTTVGGSVATPTAGGAAAVPARVGAVRDPTLVVEFAAGQGPAGPPGPLGPLGLAGPPGPVGPSSTDLVATAGQDLGGQRAVLWQDGVMIYADPTAADPTIQVIGITVGAAAAGQPVQVRTAGVMSDPSFAFAPGQAVYLGPAGALTQVQPAMPQAAVDAPIGTALGPTDLLIRIGQAISLT